ncbi:MAG TPA: hypothetical protein VLA72_20890, partial [Anaerolineales bacterium]|nr:hypothetical protein [Anaerolineales bacterium]
CLAHPDSGGVNWVHVGRGAGDLFDRCQATGMIPVAMRHQDMPDIGHLPADSLYRFLNCLRAVGRTYIYKC